MCFIGLLFTSGWCHKWSCGARHIPNLVERWVVCIMMEMLRLYPVHKRKKKEKKTDVYLTDTGVLSWKCPKNQHLEISVIISLQPGLHIRLIWSRPVYWQTQSSEMTFFFFFFFFYFWWLKSGFLFTPVCQAECSSRRAPASRVFCPVMLKANWSWSRNVLHFIYKTERRRGRTRERTRVSAQCGRRVTWIQTHRHTHTHTHTHTPSLHAVAR